MYKSIIELYNKMIDKINNNFSNYVIDDYSFLIIHNHSDYDNELPLINVIDSLSLHDGTELYKSTIIDIKINYDIDSKVPEIKNIKLSFNKPIEMSFILNPNAENIKTLINKIKEREKIIKTMKFSKHFEIY